MTKSFDNEVSEVEIKKSLEFTFPNLEISKIAEHESWRKEINRPIYHIHKWWATRLGSVFRAITLAALSPVGTNTWEDFYKHHDFSGKVVLDPFMGSGTTLGEAVKLGAKAVGCDINPISTFLVKQAFTRVSEKCLRIELDKLSVSVASDIQTYYQTIDPLTGNSINVLYYFWIKLVTTPSGESIPLFSSYIFAKDAYPKKKPKAQIICPKCWNVIEGRYDTHIIECTSCSHTFNPQEGPAKGQYLITKNGRYRIKDLISNTNNPPEHKLYAMLAIRKNGDKVYLPAKDFDKELYAKAEARYESLELPIPEMHVRPGHNTNQALEYNYKYWRDFFNKRQLLCLGLLLNKILEISNIETQEQMLCLFSSTLEFNNLFCSYKGEGTGAVRHMFSNHILKPERAPLENSIWGQKKSSGTFSTLFESRLLRAKKYLDIPFELELEHDVNGEKSASKKYLASSPINVHQVDSWDNLVTTDRSIMILNGDSARLPIPNESIDAVITDPPYFDYVHYSELSDFFFAWLAPILESRYSWFSKQNSSDIGEVQHKDPRIFSRQLGKVFTECSRVLKKDGLLAFSFHHSRAEGWAAIYEAINLSGLYVVASYPVHAELRGSSPKSSSISPISIDAILVCKKNQYQLKETNVDVFEEVLLKTNILVNSLQNGGLKISTADSFVIAASQYLVSTNDKLISFDIASNQIEHLRRVLFDNERIN